MFLSFNKPSQARIDDKGSFSKKHKSQRHNNIRNNFVEHTMVTKKPSGWQKYDSPSYEKLPSGKHNTKKSLLTRGARVLGEYSVEVAVQTVNLLLSGSGGSTPHSPIIQSVNIGYEEAVRDVRNSRLVDCRYKYAENPHKAG